MRLTSSCEALRLGSGLPYRKASYPSSSEVAKKPSDSNNAVAVDLSLVLVGVLRTTRLCFDMWPVCTQKNVLSEKSREYFLDHARV